LNFFLFQSTVSKIPSAAAVGTVDNNLLSPVSVSNGVNGFDEWLASDFQFGLLAGDDSPALSLSSSPCTATEDSPVLGFLEFSMTSPVKEKGSD